MNAKYFADLTAIVLATGLSLPMAQAQASQVVLKKMFNNFLVQRSPKSSSRLRDSPSPPPPVDGVQERSDCSRNQFSPPLMTQLDTVIKVAIAI